MNSYIARLSSITTLSIAFAGCAVEAAPNEGATGTVDERLMLFPISPVTQTGFDTLGCMLSARSLLATAKRASDLASSNCLLNWETIDAARTSYQTKWAQGSASCGTSFTADPSTIEAKALMGKAESTCLSKLEMALCHYAYSEFVSESKAALADYYAGCVGNWASHRAESERRYRDLNPQYSVPPMCSDSAWKLVSAEADAMHANVIGTDAYCRSKEKVSERCPIVSSLNVTRQLEFLGAACKTTHLSMTERQCGDIHDLQDCAGYFGQRKGTVSGSSLTCNKEVNVVIDACMGPSGELLE